MILIYKATNVIEYVLIVRVPGQADGVLGVNTPEHSNRLSSVGDEKMVTWKVGAREISW